MDSKEYLLFNRFFAGLGLLSLLYFSLFHWLPPWLQVPSACTGESFCTSEGMTRAINALIRGDFKKAALFNGLVWWFCVPYLVHIAYRLAMSLKTLKYPNALPWIDLGLSLSTLIFVFVLFL